MGRTVPGREGVLSPRVGSRDPADLSVAIVPPLSLIRSRIRLTEYPERDGVRLRTVERDRRE